MVEKRRPVRNTEDFTRIGKETPYYQPGANLSQTVTDDGKAVIPPGLQETILKLASVHDLYRFVRLAWPYADQGSPFRPFWHQQLICEHLEAFARREIKHLVVNCPPGVGKPLDVNTIVLMGDGTRKRLGDIRVGEFVIAKDGLPHRVSAVHEQGERECVKITTHSGRSVIAALDHPFLTPDGWVEAGKLSVGQPLALLNEVLIFATSKRTDAEAKLAGYFVGDGSIGPAGNSIQARITTTSSAYLDDIIACCASLGFQCRIVQRRPNAKPSRKLVYEINVSKGVRKWLYDIGIAGQKSRDKKVPAFVFSSSPAVASHFLATYFHCDGSCYKKGRNRLHHVIEFGSTSEDLLSGVQHLLQRFGIFSCFRKRNKRNLPWAGPDYVSYRLAIHAEDDSAKFAKRIPVIGPKRAQLEDCPFQRTRFDSQYVADPIVSIEPCGKRSCRCLSIEGEDSFTANDFVVHNSIIISVMFPVWVWTHTPSAKFLCASYREDIARRFARWARNLIKTPWYAEFWRVYDSLHGGTTTLRADAEAVLQYENTRGGWRLSVVVGGGFASHPNFIIIDDPYNPKEAASAKERQQVENWYFETILTRGAALDAGHLINQQRLHPDDLPGLVRDNPDYTFLILPMEYDPKLVVQMPGSTPDPRKKKGELLCPELIDDAKLKALKLMPSHTYAGQFQQQPTAARGEMFQRRWFTDNAIEQLPPKEKIVASCRFWDKAYSDSNRADYTCGVLMLFDGDYYYVADVIRFRARPHERDQRIRVVAENDVQHWPRYVVAMEEESGAGKQSAEMSVRSLAGFKVRLRKPPEGKPKPGEDDPKVWESYLIQLGMGNIKILKASWFDEFAREHLAAPNGTHDDQIDAAAGAFRELAIYSQKKRLTRPLLLLNKKERNLLTSKKKDAEKPLDPIQEALADVAAISSPSEGWVQRYW